MPHENCIFYCFAVLNLIGWAAIYLLSEMKAVKKQWRTIKSAPCCGTLSREVIRAAVKGARKRRKEADLKKCKREIKKCSEKMITDWEFAHGGTMQVLITTTEEKK